MCHLQGPCDAGAFFVANAPNFLPRRPVRDRAACAMTGVIRTWTNKAQKTRPRADVGYLALSSEVAFYIRRIAALSGEERDRDTEEVCKQDEIQA
jgi:hypothetical protein